MNTQDTQVLAQVIAQAVVLALTEAGITPAPAAVHPPASTRKQARKKDALSVAAEKARTRKAQKESAPAPTGVVAAKGVSYKLVDKALNMRKQCVMPKCRKLRKGKSRFCPDHAKENFASIRAKKGSIDD